MGPVDGAGLPAKVGVSDMRRRLFELPIGAFGIRLLEPFDGAGLTSDVALTFLGAIAMTVANVLDSLGLSDGRKNDGMGNFKEESEDESRGRRQDSGGWRATV